MRQILLVQGKCALVDNNDYEWLNQWVWRYENGYATRTEIKRLVNGEYKQKTIWMHRIINNTPDGLFTDHINGNRSDNRRENLRTCTIAENTRNSRISSNNKSGYKGIFATPYGTWRAGLTITKNGKRKSIYFGSHSTKEAAALAYDDGALKYFGEFANLNFKRAV